VSIATFAQVGTGIVRMPTVLADHIDNAPAVIPLLYVHERKRRYLGPP
jgi:hypothetical protein